jgi:sugar lactone lactonase YvrE
MHRGRVQIAAGQARVFGLPGELLDVIQTPQHPTSLIFGGANRETLFLTARIALFSVPVR